MKTMELIEHKRNLAGVSKVQLAEMVGISRQYLYAAFKFNQMTNLPVLKKISRVLNIPDEQIKKCLIEDFSVDISIKWDAIQ